CWADGPLSTLWCAERASMLSRYPWTECLSEHNREFPAEWPPSYESRGFLEGDRELSPSHIASEDAREIAESLNRSFPVLFGVGFIRGATPPISRQLISS